MVGFLRYFRSHRYFARVVLLFTLTVTIVLVVFSAVVSSQVARVIEAREEVANQRVLSQLELSISRLNELVVNTVLGVYFNPDTRVVMGWPGGNPVEIRDELRRLDASFMQANRFVHSILIYNWPQDVFISVDDAQRYDRTAIADVTDRFETVPKLSPIHRRIETSHAAGTTEEASVFSYFLYSRPGLDGLLRESVIVNIADVWFLQNIEAANERRAQGDASILLLDEHGRVLASGPSETSRSSESLVESVRDVRGLVGAEPAPGSRRSDAPAIATVTRRTAGGRMRVSVVPLESLGWTLVSLEPYETAYGYLIHLRWFLGLTTAAFLLLGSGLAAVVSRRLYGPIDSLVEAVRDAAGRNPELAPHADARGSELTFVQEAFRSAQERIRAFEEERRESLRLVRRSILWQLIQRSEDLTEVEYDEFRSHNGIAFEYTDGFLVAVAHAGGVPAGADTSEVDAAESVRPARPVRVLESIRETVSTAGNHPWEILQRDVDDYVFVVSGVENASDLESMARCAHAAMEEILGPTALSAAPGGGVQSLRAAYARASENLAYRYLFGRSALILPQTVERRERNHAPATDEQRTADLLAAVHRGDAEGASLILRETAELIRTMRYHDARRAAGETIGTVERGIRDLGRNSIEPVDPRLFALVDRAYGSPAVDEAFEALLALVDVIALRESRRSSQRTDRIIAAVDTIVDERFSDKNLCLKMIAGELGMSPAYLGRLYREHAGTSVAQRINSVRLDRARDFLAVQDASVSEIKDEVGFVNDSHFYKLFKDRFGATPKEYVLRQSLDRATSEDAPRDV